MALPLHNFSYHTWKNCRILKILEVHVRETTLTDVSFATSHLYSIQCCVVRHFHFPFDQAPSPTHIGPWGTLPIPNPSPLICQPIPHPLTTPCTTSHTDICRPHIVAPETSWFHRPESEKESNCFFL